MLKQGGNGLPPGCGHARGVLFDRSRPAWQGGGPRPVQWSAWYPIDEGADVPDHPATATDFFEPGAILPDAEPFGGTADSIGWMARLLATQGSIVIAANHHGNTGMETYCPEGFLCWWERARDLAFLLDHFATDIWIGPMLAEAPVKVIGYSLGAHAALALIGGVTSMPQFQEFGRNYPAMARGPREFPDLGEKVEGLFETSPAFRES